MNLFKKKDEKDASQKGEAAQRKDPCRDGHQAGGHENLTFSERGKMVEGALYTIYWVPTLTYESWCLRCGVRFRASEALSSLAVKYLKENTKPKSK